MKTKCNKCNTNLFINRTTVSERTLEQILDNYPTDLSEYLDKHDEVDSLELKCYGCDHPTTDQEVLDFLINTYACPTNISHITITT